MSYTHACTHNRHPRSPFASHISCACVCAVDVTVYHDGVHADLNETFLVGNVDEEGVNLVKTTYECLMMAIAECKWTHRVGATQCWSLHLNVMFRPLNPHWVTRSSDAPSSAGIVSATNCISGILVRLVWWLSYCSLGGWVGCLFVCLFVLGGEGAAKLWCGKGHCLEC